jgi:hypothetical protein
MYDFLHPGKGMGNNKALSDSWPNKPVELTGHSVGVFSFTTVITSGQQLTGGVELNRCAVALTM